MYLIIVSTSLGARGFSRVRRNFRCWPKAEATSGEAGGKTFRAVHYKELTETGNRARKVSGTQGISALTNSCFLLSTSLSLF